MIPYSERNNSLDLTSNILLKNELPFLFFRTDVNLNDIDLIELNEAFAVQSIAVIRELGLNMEILNVNGGAISLGHPVGASGARILVTLIYEMIRRGSDYGLATLCIGGGMGEATIIRRI